ncbi:MAG: hypothetical protein RL153_2216 [Verrucomicrobiota bacterium]
MGGARRGRVVRGAVGSPWAEWVCGGRGRGRECRAWELWARGFGWAGECGVGTGDGAGDSAERGGRATECSGARGGRRGPRVHGQWVPGRRYRMQGTLEASAPYVWQDFEPVADRAASPSPREGARPTDCPTAVSWIMEVDPHGRRTRAQGWPRGGGDGVGRVGWLASLASAVTLASGVLRRRWSDGMRRTGRLGVFLSPPCDPRNGSRRGFQDEERALPSGRMGSRAGTQGLTLRVRSR